MPASSAPPCTVRGLDFCCRHTFARLTVLPSNRAQTWRPSLPARVPAAKRVPPEHAPCALHAVAQSRVSTKADAFRDRSTSAICKQSARAWCGSVRCPGQGRTLNRCGAAAYDVTASARCGQILVEHAVGSWLTCRLYHGWHALPRHAAATSHARAEYGHHDGSGVRVATCTSTGRRAGRMEDCVAVDRVAVGCARAPVLGVYDGHGGAACAQFAASQMAGCIEHALCQGADLVAALSKRWVEGWRVEGFVGGSGCCRWRRGRRRAEAPQRRPAARGARGRLPSSALL